MKKNLFLLLPVFTLFLLFSCNENSTIQPEKHPDLLGKKNIPENMILTEVNNVKIQKSNINSLYLWEDDFGSSLNQTDDMGTYVELPFEFLFYGITYNAVWVNSNGNITFDGENGDWSHPDIPDENLVIIAPLYGDFDPNKDGDIYINFVEVGTKRERMVVTWANVPEYSPADDSNTFQLHLFNKKGAIVFGYNGLGTDGINWSYSPPSLDGNMDVGISSGSGDFINSASGTDIPMLDHTNIVYLPDRSGNYQEIKSPTRSKLKSLGIL